MTPVRRTAGAAAVLALAGYGARELLHAQARTARRIIGKPLGEDAIDANRTWRRRYARNGRPAAAAAGAGRLDRRRARGGAAQGDLRRPARDPARQGDAPAGDPAEPRSGRRRVVDAGGAGGHARGGLPRGRRRGGGRRQRRHPPGARSRPRCGTWRDASTRCTPAASRWWSAPVRISRRLRAVPQPLRSLGGLASRQLAVAQREAAVERGAHAVSLGTGDGPALRHEPRRDVQPGPVPPEPARLQADREGDAAVGRSAALWAWATDLPYGHHAPAPADR